MKNLLILMLFCFSVVIIAQTPNWTEVKETNINLSSVYWLYEGVDIYTNRYGNHIILQEVANLKYYRMNINGVASSPITIESSYVVSPSISGDADNIYIVYGIGSQVRVQRSTNGGTDWSLWTSFGLLTTADRMESVVSNGNLHVTYLESGIVKYRYRNLSIGPWSQIREVSNGENGTNPRITARYNGENNDYVYFVWQKQGTHLVNWRRFEVTSNTLGDKKYGYEVNELNLLSSKPMGFNVTSSTIIFYYYYKVDEPEEESTTRLFRWLYKDLNNNYLSTSAPDLNHWHRNNVYSTTTSDNKSHVVYYLNQGGEKTFDIWRSNSINGYWDDNVYDYDDSFPPFWKDGPRYINNSSAGNEVHVIWRDEFGNNGGNNLRYKYDDQVPLAPQNLTSYLDPEPGCNCHGSGPGIRLDWDENNEPDLSHYIIYRAEEPGNCNDCHQSSNSNPEDSLSNPESLNEPITLEQDCPALAEEITDFTTTKVEVETGCQSGLESTQKLTFEAIWAWPQNWWMDIVNIQGDYTYIYYVSAVDATEHESFESNFTLTYVPPGLSKGLVPFSGDVVPRIFFLYQNHPNPFNPVTTIRYQVPKETDVMIEIFNLLGQKVRTLVNEFKAEGYYSVEWNGKNDFEQSLPSGIYLYKMTAGSFSETKKMLLLK